MSAAHHGLTGGGSPDGGQRASGQSHASHQDHLPLLQRSAHAPVPGGQPQRSGGPGLDAGALRQYIASLSRREERPQRASGKPSSLALVSGPTPAGEEAQGGAESRPRNRQARHSRLPPGAYAIHKAPVRGYWGREKSAARAERSGAGAFRVRPLGGGGGDKGAASTRALLSPPGGPEHRLAAQQSAGAVRRRRCISRCTDRSAGGCADRRTAVTARARATAAGHQRFASGWRRQRGQPRGAAWADRGGRHQASASARSCGLSTKAGENGALPHANWCCQWGVSIVPAGEACGRVRRGEAPWKPWCARGKTDARTA